MEWQDGYYDYRDLKDAMNKDFASEKELCDYIETNIKLFCTDCLDVIPKECTREFGLLNYGNPRNYKRSGRRLDFLIRDFDNKVIAIECKAPTHPAELSYAIGQSLTYIALLARMGIKVDRFIILSTKLDSALPDTIKHFDLPLEYIVFDKDKFLKMIKICRLPKEINSGN